MADDRGANKPSSMVRRRENTVSRLQQPPRRPRPEVGQEERVTPGHCQREAVCTGPHHVGLQCTAVPHG